MPDENKLIVHDVKTQFFENLLDLPDAKFIESEGLHGISQLTAVKVDPRTGSEVGDFQFKLMFSPRKTIVRLELYDPNIFAIILEQLRDGGYQIISSGEDVEFAQGLKGGWLGWAHLERQ